MTDNGDVLDRTDGPFWLANRATARYLPRVLRIVEWRPWDGVVERDNQLHDCVDAVVEGRE